MSRRRNRLQGAQADAPSDQISDIDDVEADETAETAADEGPVKLDLETLHAVPLAPPRVSLLAAINAAIAAAERAHAFAAAGALHIAAHAVTELVAALPAARDAIPGDDLAARLSALAAELS